MVVPTTKRQYYDTTKKESSLAAYSGAIREGAEAWGKLFDGQQKANMESLQIDVENEVKNEFARKSPEYDNNPDNPEFKQYMDDFRKQKYSEAREQVNPFYRGQFDALTRENDKRYNSAFDGWKIKQRQANASANVKKISQDMINTAYLAGQSSEPNAFEDAKAQYNRQIAEIRNISTLTLGARATEQGIEDLNKQYLVSFATGKIESDPYGAEKLIKDSEFVKQVGAENALKLKNFAAAKIKEVEKAKYNQIIDTFNSNPTKQALDEIKAQSIVKVSDKTLSEMEEMYKASPNYICETETEAVTSIVDKIADFSSNDYRVKEGENKGAFDYEKQFNDAIELSHYIMTQNSKNGKLSQPKMQEYMKQVSQIMSNDVTKRAMMNTKGEFRSFSDNYMSAIIPALNLSGLNKKRVVSSGDKAILDGLVSGYIGEAMARISLGDEDGARKVLKDGNRAILDWKTPEIKGKNIGDTFIKDGRVYEIKSFDSSDFSVKLL